jgi:hypothetical protein
MVNMCTETHVAIFVEFIPLCYIILKLTHLLLSTTTNVISFVNTCYMFWCADHPQVLKYVTLKLKIKCIKHFVVVDGSMYVSFK